MYKITHSLLGAWEYATGEYADENSLEEFRRTLRREPQKQNKAAVLGCEFEDNVTFYAKHGQFQQPTATYTRAEQLAIKTFGDKLRGAVPQIKTSKVIRLMEMDFKLVGVADFVKAGVIYDTKRVQHYEYGKYFKSTQHPMYFELFPEAWQFTYLIFNGQDALEETYLRRDAEPIELAIRRFIRDMRSIGELETYKKYWEV